MTTLITNTTSTRIGGDLVLEALTAVGATGVVGLPGQHALGLFDALRRSDLTYLSSRVENNAGFMADGLARVTGTVAPLILSTGPGALTSLAALQEAAASSIPVLAISAQIPVHGLGGGRHGYLHELPEQAASFRGVVKHTFTVRHISQIVPAILQAAEEALATPAGPVLIEIPQDVLLEPTNESLPTPEPQTVSTRTPQTSKALLDTVVDALASAKQPVIIAGGGVNIAQAQQELLVVAEFLASPVVTTFGGKGAFPWEHPLSMQSWIEDKYTTDTLNSADVLLVVGSGLGELSSNYFTLNPSGIFIHIEADLGKVTSNHAGIGVHADARNALSYIGEQLQEKAQPAGRDLQAQKETGVADLLEVIQGRLDGQDLDKERALLASLRDDTPDTTDTFWDMTILAYWAWSAWDKRDGIFASAQGAGGLGYALPAAMGAALGNGISGKKGSVLAVSGDGGALYGIAELATLAQHQLDVVWLIVDDGGYGILREYMQAEFGEATATELARPDYVKLAESFNIPARSTSIHEASTHIAEALASGGPHVIVLETHLSLFAPSHETPTV